MAADRQSLSDHRASQAEGWRKVAVSDARAWKARAEKAEAENERLREALKHIAEADVELFTGKPQRPSGEYCVDVAKKALAIDETEAR